VTGALVMLTFLVLAPDHAAVAGEILHSGPQGGAFGKRFLCGVTAGKIALHIEVGAGIAGRFLLFNNFQLLFMGLFGLHDLLLPFERTGAKPPESGTVPLSEHALALDAFGNGRRERQRTEGEDGNESQNEQVRHLKSLQ
jgi:hypothetical protein